MSGIIIKKEQTNQSKYTADLFRSAEQRINFVYMMLMIAFEVSVGIYILIIQLYLQILMIVGSSYLS